MHTDMDFSKIYVNYLNYLNYLNCPENLTTKTHTKSHTNTRAATIKYHPWTIVPFWF